MEYIPRSQQILQMPSLLRKESAPIARTCKLDPSCTKPSKGHKLFKGKRSSGVTFSDRVAHYEPVKIIEKKDKSDTKDKKIKSKKLKTIKPKKQKFHVNPDEVDIDVLEDFRDETNSKSRGKLRRSEQQRFGEWFSNLTGTNIMTGESI